MAWILLASVADSAEIQAVERVVAMLDAGILPPGLREGIEFKNREGRLPQQPAGYYREYTVPTSGVTGRGERRIVSGGSRELYYSRDHYGSFLQLR